MTSCIVFAASAQSNGDCSETCIKRASKEDCFRGWNTDGTLRLSISSCLDSRIRMVLVFGSIISTLLPTTGWRFSTSEPRPRQGLSQQCPGPQPHLHRLCRISPRNLVLVYFHTLYRVSAITASPYNPFHTFTAVSQISRHFTASFFQLYRCSSDLASPYSPFFNSTVLSQVLILFPRPCVTLQLFSRLDHYFFRVEDLKVKIGKLSAQNTANVPMICKSLLCSPQVF